MTGLYDRTRPVSTSESGREFVWSRVQLVFLTCLGVTGRTESSVSNDLTRSIIKRALWKHSGSDQTLGELSLVIGEKGVWLVVQRRVGDRTRPRLVRSLDLGTSGQEYARVGASRWRATIIFEWLVHMAHKERPDFGPNSGPNLHLHVRSLQLQVRSV